MSRSLRLALALCLLAVLVSAPYLPWLDNEFIYDDHKIVEQHPGVHSLSDLVQLFREPHFPRFPYYRPITRTTLLVQKGIHGDHPPHFHLFNAGLMGAMAVLVYHLLRTAVFKIAVVPALLGAAAFTLHPVASGCVYPICSGRETLMPAVFVVVSLSFHLQPGNRARLLSLVFFGFALFCKEQAVVLPPLLVLADWLGLCGGPRKSRLTEWVRHYGPYFVVAALYFLVRRSIFSGSDLKLAILDSPFKPLLSYLYGLQVILAPFAPLVYEPLTSVWWSWPRMVAVTAVVTAVFLLQKRTRFVERPILMFWAAWFFLVQLPTAHVFRQEAPFAERYVFLAALPLFAIGAAAVSHFWTRPGTSRRLALGLAVVVIASSATISHLRGAYFKDDETFARQWLDTNPDAYEAHYSLGTFYVEQENHEHAVQHFRAAVEIKPDFVDVHLSCALSLHAMGQTDEALRHLQQALKFRPDGPHANAILGRVRLDLGQLDQATQCFEKALAADPNLVDAHVNLGVIYGRKSGQVTGEQKKQYLEQAAEHFKAAVQAAPDSLEAHSNLGTFYQQTGNLDQAEQEFLTALAIDSTAPRPLQALARLAEQHAKAGRFPVAIRVGETARTAAISAGRQPLAQRLAENLREWRAREGQ